MASTGSSIDALYAGIKPEMMPIINETNNPNSMFDP